LPRPFRRRGIEASDVGRIVSGSRTSRKHFALDSGQGRVQPDQQIEVHKGPCWLRDSWSRNKKIFFLLKNVNFISWPSKSKFLLLKVWLNFFCPLSSLGYKISMHVMYVMYVMGTKHCVFTLSELNSDLRDFRLLWKIWPFKKFFSAILTMSVFMKRFIPTFNAFILSKITKLLQHLQRTQLGVETCNAKNVRKSHCLSYWCPCVQKLDLSLPNSLSKKWQNDDLDPRPDPESESDVEMAAAVQLRGDISPLTPPPRCPFCSSVSAEQ
jgi:hypothetical protein